MERLHVDDGVWIGVVAKDEVVDAEMLAFGEADPETGVRQGGQVVADVDVLLCHVDEELGHGQLVDLFLFLGLQHFHEAEVLGGHLAVLVAEQHVVRRFLADDDQPDPVDAEDVFEAFLDGANFLFVQILKDDDDG